MKRPLSTEEKRYRRHVGKAQQAGARCAICQQGVARGRAVDASGLAVEWLDEAHRERGCILFILCRLCMVTNYADTLTRLHRQVWHKRHGADPPAPISLLREENA
jgi:hypothetical protein